MLAIVKVYLIAFCKRQSISFENSRRKKECRRVSKVCWGQI